MSWKALLLFFVIIIIIIIYYNYNYNYNIIIIIIIIVTQGPCLPAGAMHFPPLSHWNCWICPSLAHCQPSGEAMALGLHWGTFNWVPGVLTRAACQAPYHQSGVAQLSGNNCNICTLLAALEVSRRHMQMKRHNELT